MIGSLNNHLQELSLRCTKKGSAARLHPSPIGDPLKGERLLVSWAELNTGGDLSRNFQSVSQIF